MPEPHIRHDDYLAIKNALIILRDGSLTASMASNAAPALEALERLEKRLAKSLEEDATLAQRVARLEEMHGGIRAHDGRVVA